MSANTFEYVVCVVKMIRNSNKQKWWENFQKQWIRSNWDNDSVCESVLRCDCITAHIQLNYVFIIKMDDVTGSSPPTVPQHETF